MDIRICERKTSMLHHTSIHLETDMVNVCIQSASSDNIELPVSAYMRLATPTLIFSSELDGSWSDTSMATPVCGGHSLVGLASG